MSALATVTALPLPADVPPPCTCEHDSHWPDDRYARSSRYRRASFALHAAGARLPRGARRPGVCASCTAAGHESTTPIK